MLQSLAILVLVKSTNRQQRSRPGRLHVMEALLSSRKVGVDLQRHLLACVEGELEIAPQHLEGAQ
jgi:hypothetical protein